MTKPPAKVYVKDDYGFVGWRGQSIRLNKGDEHDLDSEIVQDLPDMFTAAGPAGDEEPAARRGGRRRG